MIGFSDKSNFDSVFRYFNEDKSHNMLYIILFILVLEG